MKMFSDVTGMRKLLSTVQGSATNYDCPEQFFLPTKNGLWNLDDSQSWALWPKNPWHSQKIGAKLSHIISSLHTHKASNSKENYKIERWKKNPWQFIRQMCTLLRILRIYQGSCILRRPQKFEINLLLFDFSWKIFKVFFFLLRIY